MFSSLLVPSWWIHLGVAIGAVVGLIILVGVVVFMQWLQGRRFMKKFNYRYRPQSQPKPSRAMHKKLKSQENIARRIRNAIRALKGEVYNLEVNMNEPDDANPAHIVKVWFTHTKNHHLLTARVDILGSPENEEITVVYSSGEVDKGTIQQADSLIQEMCEYIYNQQYGKAG